MEFNNNLLRVQIIDQSKPIDENFISSLMDTAVNSGTKKIQIEASKDKLKEIEDYLFKDTINVNYNNRKIKEEFNYKGQFTKLISKHEFTLELKELK